MIVARLQAGRRLKKAAGGYAGGQPPYGWRGGDQSGELVPHPGEQATLARLRELSAAGASTYAVADALNAEGHTTRRGGRWSSQSVSVHLRAAAPSARPA